MSFLKPSIETFEAEVEPRIPSLLRDRARWHSLYVDYHAPFVERLWCQLDEENRLMLHRIYPCGPGEALLHCHPWKSVVRMISGTYEMEIAYDAGEKKPRIATRQKFDAGSIYEMLDLEAYHSVRPIGGPTLSSMLIGKPENIGLPKPTKLLLPLSKQKEDELFDLFRASYG